jgi:FkbM family methyltransferase
VDNRRLACPPRGRWDILTLMTVDLQVNETLHRQLETAVGRIRRRPIMKLIDPGAMRFAVRTLRRWTRQSSRYRIPLFFDREMTVLLPEFVSEFIYTYGFFDEEVSYIFVAAVERGDTVIDVGAHFGYFSLLAAALTGEGGEVHAFEPTPSTFEITRMNLSGLSNVTAVNAGAGETAGRLELLDFGVRYSAFNSFASDLRLPSMARPDSHRVAVPIIALDDYIEEHGLTPGFIKVDAENFEMPVVSGLRRTLARCSPRILLETGSDSSQQAGEQLVAAGYRLYVSKRFGDLHACAEPLAEANRGYKDILFSRSGLPGGS